MRHAALLLFALLLASGGARADGGPDAGLDGGSDTDVDADTDSDADVDAAPDAAGDGGDDAGEAGPLEPDIEMVCKCGAVGARGGWSLLALLLR